MKNLLLILSFIYFSLQVNAQKFYVNVNGGYALKTGSQQSGFWALYNYSVQSSIDYLSVKPFSFGQGLHTKINIGYIINKNIGAELGFSYIYGYKFKATEVSDNSHDSKTVTYAYSRIKIINPSIVFYSNNENKIYLFSKVGFLIAKPIVYVDNELTQYEYPDTITIHTINKTHKLYNSFSIGISASLGINYSISKKVKLTFDFTYQGMSFTPTKQSMIKYTTDGVDVLDNQTISYREIDYVNTISSEDNQLSSVPTKNLKFALPLSSIGFNLGINYSF